MIYLLILGLCHVKICAVDLYQVYVQYSNIYNTYIYLQEHIEETEVR